MPRSLRLHAGAGVLSRLLALANNRARPAIFCHSHGGAGSGLGQLRGPAPPKASSALSGGCNQLAGHGCSLPLAPPAGSSTRPQCSSQTRGIRWHTWPLLPHHPPTHAHAPALTWPRARWRTRPRPAAFRIAANWGAQTARPAAPAAAGGRAAVTAV